MLTPNHSLARQGQVNLQVFTKKKYCSSTNFHIVLPTVFWHGLRQKIKEKYTIFIAAKTLQKYSYIVVNKYNIFLCVSGGFSERFCVWREFFILVEDAFQRLVNKKDWARDRQRQPRPVRFLWPTGNPSCPAKLELTPKEKDSKKLHWIVHYKEL